MIQRVSLNHIKKNRVQIHNMVDFLMMIIQDHLIHKMIIFDVVKVEINLV